MLLISTFSALALAGSLMLPSHTPPQDNDLTFWVTDLGINQWSPWLTVGGDLLQAKNLVFPELDTVGQILIPMPPKEHVDVLLAGDRLQSYITDVVRQRVESGLAAGQTSFEIQLVQDIDSAGYARASLQQSVEQFSAAAYSAIGKVVSSLERRGRNVYSHAIVGSNGATMLAASAAQASWLDGADLFDGRALKPDVVRLIETLGAPNVRFFNTAGDLPAPNNPIMRSIGNFDVVKGLKERFPEISSFLLTPIDRDYEFGSGHIAGMTAHSERFLVHEHVGKGKFRSPEPWALRGQDLRPMARDLEGRYSSQPPSLLLESIATSVSELNRLASFTDDALFTPILPKNLKRALSLLPAVLADAQAKQRGALHPLTSHTLEQTSSFLLGKLPDIINALKSSGKLSRSFKLPSTLYGIDDFVLAGASAAGGRRIGLNEITHALDGFSRLTAAIAGGLVGGAQGAKGAEATASYATHVLRGATYSLFDSFAKRGARRQMAADWLTLQERRIADGLETQLFDQMFKPGELRAAGFDAEAIEALNARHTWATRELKDPADLGGVNIAPQLVGMTADLARLRAQVLDVRAGAPSLEGSRTTLWAVSLGELQDRLEASGYDLAQCDDEIAELGGLTRIDGWVYEESTNEVILFGLRDLEARPLETEDLIVSLRNSFGLYDVYDRPTNTWVHTAPGVSIDPIQATLLALQRIGEDLQRAATPADIEREIDSWLTTCKQPQGTRILGVPPSKLALCALLSDALLKSIVNGDMDLGVDGLVGMPQAMVAQMEAELRDTGGEATAATRFSPMNRFEFVGGTMQYDFDDDAQVVRVRSSPIKLITEAEFLSRSGDVVGTDEEDPVAAEFCRVFTAAFPDLDIPFFVDLRSMYRHVGLSLLASQRLPRQALAGLLDRAIVPERVVPRTIDGVASVERFYREEKTPDGLYRTSLWIPSCGGVSVRFRDIKPNPVDLAAIRAAVLANRAGPDVLAWACGS